MGTNERKKRLFWKQILLLIVLVIVGWYGLGELKRHFQNSDLLTVAFRAPNGKFSPEYHVRIARSPSEREYGLMYVPPDELQGGKGMIFLFPQEKEEKFWMKNTISPLDMIFINKAREVVGVVENAPPYSTATQTVGKPSTYVLELLAGTAFKDGVTAGSTLVEPLNLPTAE